MPTIVHFDLSAEDPARAREFYEGLFGWKLVSPGLPDYYLIETADLEGKPGIGGGMGRRDEPGQGMVNYIGVDSVDDYVAKVEKLGGRLVQPKMPVPGWGYLAVCEDTEGIIFGLWQEDPQSK